MTHEPPTADPQQDCPHTVTLATDTAFTCPDCGLTIPRQPDRRSYLDAARAALTPKGKP